jgi:hypothetical protein
MNNTNHSKSIPQRARHHLCRWCLLPLLLLLALPAAVEAQFLYATINGTITITGYTGPSGAVTIPSTLNGLPVTSIGDSAFASCSGLTSVTMGPSVTSIEFLAFQLCTSLTSITIGTSVTSIGQGAFSGCNSLANVIIPASVTSIGLNAFSGCYRLISIRVDTNNPAYSSVDGVLFNKSQTTLFQYPVASAATSYTIPNSVTSIGVGAFSGCSLTSVTFGPGVTSIGDFAFAGCSGLTSVSIGNSVTSIGVFAFQWCPLTSLTIGTSVTNIGYHAFEHCTSLTNLIIPASVTSIGDGAFEECSSLSWIRVDTNNPAYSSVDGVLFNKSETTLVQYPIASAATSYTIPNSVTSIGYYAFEGCPRLANITIENNVTSIGDSAFASCSGLTSLTIGSSVTSIGDFAFSFTSLTNLTIGNGVTSVGGFAFEECRSLTNVTIGSGVTTIGVMAFFDCMGLSSVWMGSSVTSIGGSAFIMCASLMGIYCYGNAPNLDVSPFSGDNNATVYYLPGTTGWGPTFGGRPTALWQQGAPEASTLSASSITTNSATLNGTVNPNGWPTTAWFEWGTTTSYGNLTSVADLGSGTIALPLSAPLAGLTPGITYHFRVAARNDHYGLVYGGDQSFTPSPLPLVSTLPATGVSTNSAILNGTVNLNGWPTTAWFQWGTTINYGSLTSVADLGSGTAAVPLSAPLAGLTPGVTYHFRVAATNDNGLAYGGDQSFTTLGPPQVSTLPARAVSTGSATLNGTVNPNGWPTTAWFQWGTTINYGSLTSVADLGSGTAAVPLSAPLAALTPGVTYHFRVAATNDYGLAYGSDQSFTTASLESQLAYTTNNGSITITGYTGPGGDVTIPGTINGLPVTSIGDGAFFICLSLTNVTIPNSVTSIGHMAFEFCGRLTSVSLGNAVTSIGSEPFGGCTNLTSLIVDALNPAYSSVEGVLFNKTQTKLVQYPLGLAAASYTIPNGVTSVEDGAFAFCQSLTNITFPSSVTFLGNRAFYDCGSLRSITIPDGVTSIGDWAFAECISLAGVYFEGNAPSLGGANVFPDDNHATVYYLPGTTGWGTTFGGLPTALWQPGPPEASTLTARSSTTNSATLNGTVNPNGNPTTAWFQWGTTTNYGNLTSVIALGSGTNALPLSAPLAGLTLGVTYHFRMAATNDNGLVYGSDQIFTTLGPPQVSTLPATGVSTSNATLNGTVNPNGYPTTAWFQWGATTNYGNLTSATDLGSGTTALPLSAPLAGLAPSVTYHFRIAATNDYGLVYGSDQRFTTLGLPQISTLSATDVSPNSATLNGTVNPNGWPTTAWFQWGNTTSYGNLTAATALGSGTTALPLSVPLAGLTPSVTYHFCVAATNDNGLVYGSDQSFTTQAQPGGAGWTLNGGATMTGNTIMLTVGAGDTSRSAFLNNKQDVTAFHIVFFYQDVSGAGSADGVTFCIQNDPRGATALGGGNGGSSLGYDNITPSVALAMNIYAGNGRGVALFQNGAVTYGYASLLPAVDIGGNTNIIQVNVDYNGTVMTVTFKDTVAGGIASTNWTVNIPSVVGGSTAYVGFTGADGGVASIQTISWVGSAPTILIPPRTQTAEAGSAVGLSVHATGALPLSFLWYLNDTNLISWSTDSALELTNVQIFDSGAYTVVVTNVVGAVTSAPVLVSVIAAVERRPVPGVKLTGEAGSLLSVDYADSLSPAPNWTPLGSVSLSTTSQYYFDLTLPFPPQRFYRAWQTGNPGSTPSLTLDLIPAITLTGSIGASVRLDYINRFGPIDGWVTLDTVTLTNTSQLYFDVSAPGQLPRLYRLVPSP